MSVVTNLILSFSILEDERSRVSEINFFENNGRGFELATADFERENNPSSNKTWYGGTKFLETPLYIGAYNHLDVEGLIEHLKIVNWEYPESVQLFLKEQESDKFRILELGKK